MDPSGDRPSSTAGAYPLPEGILRLYFPPIADPLPNENTARVDYTQVGYTLADNLSSTKPHPIFGLFSFATANASPPGTSAALRDDDPLVSPRTMPASRAISSVLETDVVPVVSPPLEPAQIYPNAPTYDAYNCFGNSIPGLPLPGHALPDDFDLSGPASPLSDDWQANNSSDIEEDEDDEPGYHYSPPDASRAVGPYFVHGVTSSFQSALPPPVIVTEEPKRTGKMKAGKQASAKPAANRVAALKKEAQAVKKRRAPAPSPLNLAGTLQNFAPSNFQEHDASVPPSPPVVVAGPSTTPRSTFKQPNASTLRAGRQSAPILSTTQSARTSSSTFKQPSDSTSREPGVSTSKQSAVSTSKQSAVSTSNQPDASTSNQPGASTSKQQDASVLPSTPQPTSASRSTLKQQDTSVLASTAQPTRASRSTFKKPNARNPSHKKLGSPTAPPFEPLSPPAPLHRTKSVESMTHSILAALGSKFAASRKRKPSSDNEAGPQPKKLKSHSRSPSTSPVQTTRTWRSTFKQPTSSTGLPHTRLGSPIAPPFEPLSPPTPKRRTSVDDMLHSVLDALSAELNG